jgi:hypothetical protein
MSIRMKFAASAARARGFRRSRLVRRFRAFSFYIGSTKVRGIVDC